MEFFDIWSIKLSQNDKCSECDSSEWTQCSHCNGTGTMSNGESCTVCSGKGKYCANCAEIALEDEQQGQIDERKLAELETTEEELSQYTDNFQSLYHELGPDNPYLTTFTPRKK